MQTEWIKEIHKTMDQEVFEKSGQIIKMGGLVAFPTETVYGLGGDALNPASSQKIYAAKGRPSDNPLIVHICDVGDLEVVGTDIPPVAYALAERFWPGPLTMIVKKSKIVPYETTGGLDTVAVRLPNHEVALEFIKKAGGFVAAPSANTSGRPSPTVGKYVYEDMQGKIEMLLDAGPVGIGVESTIVDLTSETPMILRPGYVTKEMLGEVLEEVSLDPTLFRADTGLRPKAPGMKYKHYAPKGELTILSGDREKAVCKMKEEAAKKKQEGFRVGIITTREFSDGFDADSIKVTGAEGDVESVARELFRFLREFDEEHIDFMYVRAVEEDGIGQAVMNRMLKAAGHRIIYI